MGDIRGFRRHGQVLEGMGEVFGRRGRIWEAKARLERHGRGIWEGWEKLGGMDKSWRLMKGIGEAYDM